MLTDEVNVKLSAGHGGPGRVSFGRRYKSGPDGGNGGRGGDVYISVTTDLFALNKFIKKSDIAAPDGEPGGSKRSSGHDGEDIDLSFPIGTTLTDLETGEQMELIDPDTKILICKGGLGGRGNFELKSARNTTPMHAQKGLPGVTRSFRANLRFLAEYGLIGLPNAGKSSLLNELTNAQAQIGNYPFTTLETNLGVYNKKIIADIPGLIEGASSGKGLGLKFLKHIEKVKMLLHCIAADSNDVLRDYKIIEQELASYDQDLAKRKKVILLTKKDLIDDKTLTGQIKTLKKLKVPVYPVSIHDYDSLQKLTTVLQ
jgi:GTPase